MKYLLDSNALIYAARLEALYAPFRQWAQRDATAFSAISRVEVPGFARLTNEDALAFAAMFRLEPELPITSEVLDAAVKIRQQFRLKTTDAVVADTALVHDLDLVTADADFIRVAELTVVNPRLTT